MMNAAQSVHELMTALRFNVKQSTVDWVWRQLGFRANVARPADLIIARVECVTHHGAQLEKH